MLSGMETLGSWLLIGGSVVVALLALVMIFYEQLLVALAWILQAMFVVGLLAASTALFVPPPYDWSAAWLVDATGVPGQLRQTDEFVQSVRELPSAVWERMRSPFSRFLPSPAPRPPLVPMPGNIPGLPVPPGPLEGRLVPALSASLSMLLRTFAFVIGVALMLIALLYRSATDLILQLRAIRNRVDVLEEAAQPAAVPPRLRL